MANIGRNYASIEPLYLLNYVDPKGFNGDLRIGYLFNQRNKDTDYTSGQEFHFDYAAGWGLGNGWTLGVGGYYRQQTRLDRQAGVSLADSKTSGMAIGPSLKYDGGKGWFMTAKWQFERNVKNGTQGNALWIKAVFPL
ncbi:transporter [Ottowia pentelensis]